MTIDWSKEFSWRGGGGGYTPTSEQLEAMNSGATKEKIDSILSKQDAGNTYTPLSDFKKIVIGDSNSGWYKVATTQFDSVDHNNVGLSMIVTPTFDSSQDSNPTAIIDISGKYFSATDKSYSAELLLNPKDDIMSKFDEGSIALYLEGDTLTVYMQTKHPEQYLICSIINQFSNAEDSKIDWIFYNEHVENLPDDVVYGVDITKAKYDSNGNDIVSTYATKDDIREIELYKTPNVIIHGEPTITHGQVSNFTSDNYVSMPFAFDFTNKRFELLTCIKTATISTQNILGSKYGISMFIDSNGRINFNVSFNGTEWDWNYVSNYILESNKTYYIKLSFTGMIYKLGFSTNGIDYVEETTSAITQWPNPQNINLGIGNNGFNKFNGVVDLNKWELRVNDIIFWEGMGDAGLATRLATDLENIDDDGIEKLINLVGGVYLGRDEASDTYAKKGSNVSDFINDADYISSEEVDIESFS